MISPDPFTFPEYQRAALITIDVQNDTLDGGAFEVPGTAQVLHPINRLCRTFRQAGRPIVHVMRIYTPDAADADLCRRSSLLAGDRVLLKGSAGRRPADPLLPGNEVLIDDDLLMSGAVQPIGPEEVLLYKPRWGAFYRTVLEAHLKEKSVSTLVFCGSNYPNCPRTSIYQASERDFKITAVVDAISGMNPTDISGLAKIGANCVTSEEVVRLLEKTFEETTL